MKRLLSLLLCLAAILPLAGCASNAHPAEPLPEEEAADTVELKWYVNYRMEEWTYPYTVYTGQYDYLLKQDYGPGLA